MEQTTPPTPTQIKPPSSPAVKPLDEIRLTLQRMEDQFKLALPSQMEVQRFTRAVMTALQTNPTLLEKNRQSLYAACMKAAQDGLFPDGKEAALVPFKDQVSYLPMIAGIYKKMRNSGELAMINAQVVFEKDEFDYYLDEKGEHLRHKPFLFGERGRPKLTYAIAQMKDGSVYVEIMTEEQMAAIKNSSRGGGASPWAGPFESEMRRKSVVKRLSKRLPSSSDIEMVLNRDDELYETRGEVRQVAPEPQVEAPARPVSRLADAVAKASAPETIPI